MVIRQPRRAFSLLEVCLAFCVLGLALLPMLTSFSQATRGVAQTSEYTQALFLTQMALEDEQARFEINPLVLLEDEASLQVQAAPVVDGGSPYFQVIEDTAEPFGRMIPGSDLAIDPAKSSLYQQLQRFQLSTDVDFRSHPEIPDSPTALAEIQVEMSWSGIDGKARYFTIPTLLARPRVNTDTQDLQVTNVAEYEDAIRRHFYPDDPEGRTLRQAVSARGADLDTMLDLGLVVIFETALENELKRCDEDIEKAKQWRGEAGAAASQQAEADIWEGKTHERKASLALHVPLRVLSRLERLAQGNFVTRLGSPPPAAERFVPQLWRFGYLPSGMLRFGREAVIAYARAAQGEPAAALPRRRLLALQYRILEMSHLLLLCGLDMKPFLQDLISQMITQQDGKNPYVVSYARNYNELLQNPDRMRQVFSAWTERIDRFTGVPAVIDRLVQQGMQLQPQIGSAQWGDGTGTPSPAPSPASGANAL